MALSEQPTLKIGLIHSGQNYRRRFSPEGMKDLREQVIAAGGVLEPIVVRPHPTIEGAYQIVAGERRWRVAQALYGDDYDMPVVLRDVNDARARALSMIENCGREDTSEIEDAQGASDLLAYNKGDRDATAKQLGWSSDLLDRRLLLLNCEPGVQTALLEEQIALGHAELLAGLAPERQIKVMEGVIAHKVPVDVLRKQLGQFARRLSDAIFDTAQCIGCKHNSAQQAALFDYSIGDGFCQHPTHYEELTLAKLEEQAVPLREQFQVVRIIRAEDGFQPLVVGAAGELGVGEEQYLSCRACANFGCSVSAIAGSYGKVDESLCFDAPCHSTKVLARRKADREAASAAKTHAAAVQAGKASASPAASPASKKATNQTPPRVKEFREAQWRKWVGNQLMQQPVRNQRVLAALIASRTLQSFDSARFIEAAGKIAKPAGVGANTFKGALEQADAFGESCLGQIVQAVTASAAFGIDVGGLELLLNYLEVEEAHHFTLNADYMELLTVSELEALADELKLRKAMGDGPFKKARAGNKAKFIEQLLAVEGFTYAGAVPKALRYARRKLRLSATAHAPAAASEPDGQDDAAASHGSEADETAGVTTH